MPGAGRRIVVQVGREQRGVRLQHFLPGAFPNGSPERARALIAAGRVRLRGKVARAGLVLFGGEALELELPPPSPLADAPSDGPTLALLGEAPGLLVIDKPSGVPVEHEPGRVTIASLLAAQRPGFDVDGLAAPGFPHRLDRDTTGCLLAARDDEALAELRAAFEGKRVQKRYLAILAGAPPERLVCDTPYGRAPDDPRRFTTKVSSARRARLTATVIARGRDAALARIALDTGRTHQIRVQLAEAGFPVVGDVVYGGAAAEGAARFGGLTRQALHAHTLELPWREGGLLRLEAPLPRDLAEACARLGLATPDSGIFGR